MRSVSVRLADLDRVKINLGIAGENEHTHVLFDCKKAFDQYPNATPFLIVTPPRGDIYPAVVTRDGDIVEWVVTDSDLIYHGNGKVQLQFKQGDIIMKSYEARTSIAISSEPTGTVPTPIQNWITQANAILASIPDDINAALAAAKASGEFDGADGVGIAAITLKSTVGLVDTYTITLTNGRDYDFTVTNGTPGQNGVGIQSIAKTSTVGLVDTYTVTLTNGQTYPFTVTNGQNGVEIDDTTPANNKVFSSAKVAEMNTDVKTAIQGLDDDKYEKPSGGIPATDMTQEVQDSLNDAETAYQKPSGGIPASDIADGVIPVVDSALSDSSENAVQNKVVKGALDTKAPVIINTATGNPAVFNDGGGMPLKSLLIPFTPRQSGTGDPSPTNVRNIVPWNGLTVFGGGKNLMNPTNYVFNTITSRGLTFEVQTDGSVKATGTTESSDFGPTLSVRFKLHAGTYCGYKDDGNVYVAYRKSTSEEGGVTTGLISPFTLDGSEWVYCNIYVRNPGTFDTILHPQIARENTQTAYEPYHPITETDIVFPSPVYGGTLDVVSGVLTVEWAEIASYNGETLPGEWLSDRDVYSAGTTPTIGAQVVYKLATPQEITLTPQQITALVGDNTIWSDADGSMTVEYPADTKTYINNLIATAIASL